MAQHPAQQAFHRVIAALHCGGQPLQVAAAFAPSAVIDRYSWGDEAGRLAERIAGRAGVAAWIARGPEGAIFSLAGDPVVQDERTASVRYHLEVAGFRGGGRWIVRLDADELVAHLQHHPDDLDPDIQNEAWRPFVEMSVQMPREANDPGAAGLPCAHDHGSTGRDR